VTIAESTTRYLFSQKSDVLCCAESVTLPASRGRHGLPDFFVKDLIFLEVRIFFRL